MTNQSTSFVIINRHSGRAVAEVGAVTAKAADARHFEVMPIGDWLGRYNRLVRENGGQEPTDSQFRFAVEG